jgi:hypothetical protein
MTLGFRIFENPFEEISTCYSSQVLIDTYRIGALVPEADGIQFMTGMQRKIYVARIS